MGKNYNIIFACILFISILIGTNGCAPVKLECKYEKTITNSHLTPISQAQFENCTRLTGFGFYERFFEMSTIFYQGRGIDEIEPRFEYIKYDTTDSSLYIKGQLFTSYNLIYSPAQVIIGIEHRDTSLAKHQRRLIVYSNYLIGVGGCFELSYKINKPALLIFAPREVYKETGEYDYIRTAYPAVYDLGRLVTLY